MNITFYTWEKFQSQNIVSHFHEAHYFKNKWMNRNNIYFKIPFDTYLIQTNKLNLILKCLFSYRLLYKMSQKQNLYNFWF